MKLFTTRKAGLLFSMSCAAASSLGFANSTAVNQANLPPQAIEHLPDGRLKHSLNKLPPHIQQQVLDKLTALGIPAIDMLLMEADNSGEIFYIEEGLTEDISTNSTDPQLELPPIDVFTLHSSPNSPNTVYLDFDGGEISGRAWGGGTTYQSTPYDLDGDPTSFNATERARIHEIWTRIADDFAAFDINVTTEVPTEFGPNVGWLLFTEDTDSNGSAMPHQGAGGVAYVNVWGRSNFTYYQPALVYYNRLGAGTATYMAEAGSHELGHNLGLSHDGTSTTSYFRGLGADSELSSWAPIMGVGYYKNVTQWSKGEYPDANQFQDDIAIITEKLGAAADTEGNMQVPTILEVEDNGQFFATNRQLDPTNVLPENKGSIQVGDSDWFQFNAGSGNAEFHATPAWDAFTRSTRRGANLDIGLRLYDSTGAVIASSEDQTNTSASLTTTLAQGLYVLEVYGTSSLYASDYGSQGHFYLHGQVAPASPDTTAPDPNPMGFAQQPTATNETSIEMQAVVAVDDNGGVVSYRFNCEQGGCTSSDWQADTAYAATNLQANTQYCFSVQARDISGNTTLASATMCTSTPEAPPQPEPPAAPSNTIATDEQNASVLLTWLDNSDNESGFEIQREFKHKNGQWRGTSLVAMPNTNTTSYIDNSGTGTYRYRVRAYNTIASSVWSNWAEVVVTDNNGGGSDKPCRGKKCSN
ncbi:zinc-dependent metalloprotease family protein [Pseudoalteromonas sp. T1lg65]|uniref:zinc-dependent metalloprotease family protein n=1 Tax=Pseudoalteromonas sp. T1lg65 TaxID=2077101 RepID=UPI003F79DBA5